MALWALVFLARIFGDLKVGRQRFRLKRGTFLPEKKGASEERGTKKRGTIYMSEPVEQINGAEQTPSDVWDQEMATMESLPADEALIYIITVMAPSADELEGHNAKEEATNMQQISTDQNLTNDMYAQYNQYGNLRLEQDNGDAPPPGGYDAAESQCITQAQYDANQINYDLATAPVYKDNSSFTTSVNDQMTSIFGGTQYITDPGDPNATADKWSSEWDNIDPPTQVSGNSKTQNEDRDPSGVESTTTAFQNMQDSFSGISNVEQQILKAQKSNMSMTQSINHSFDSSFIDQMKPFVDGSKPT